MGKNAHAHCIRESWLHSMKETSDHSERLSMDSHYYERKREEEKEEIFIIHTKPVEYKGNRENIKEN